LKALSLIAPCSPAARWRRSRRAVPEKGAELVGPVLAHEVVVDPADPRGFWTLTDTRRSEGRRARRVTSRVPRNSITVPEPILLPKPSRIRSTPATAKKPQTGARGAAIQGPHHGTDADLGEQEAGRCHILCRGGFPEKPPSLPTTVWPVLKRAVIGPPGASAGKFSVSCNPSLVKGLKQPKHRPCGRG
jgi:hypothetical protein